MDRAARQRTRRLLAAEGYLELGMADHALAELNAIADVGQDEYVVHALRAECHRARHDWAAALAEFEACHAERPQAIDALMGLAWCYKRLDRLPQAIAAMHAALEHHPEEAVLMYNLSCYYTLAGNKAQALSWLGRALRKDKQYRQLIPKETDFDNLRHDPDFRRLLEWTQET